jgi:hypothetical protein
MTDEQNVAGVRATVDRAVHSIGEMQGALNLARDRGQTAVDIIAIGTRGTASDQPGAALGMMANADRLCEEAISATLATMEALHTWEATL